MAVNANPAWAELWIVEAGRSQRPALVLTRPDAVDRMNRVLVALATTTVRGLPSEVVVGPDEGPQLRCVLDLDTPELPIRSKFIEFIAMFPIGRWDEVCDAMSAAINCG